MEFARFTLDTDKPELTVNGERVPGVTAVRVEMGVGMAAPTVIVQQHARVDRIEGVGVVHVEVPSPAGSDARSAVLAWLQSLDPEELEREALDRQGWGSGGLAADILVVLGALASEAL